MAISASTAARIVATPRASLRSSWVDSRIQPMAMRAGKQAVVGGGGWHAD